MTIRLVSRESLMKTLGMCLLLPFVFASTLIFDQSVGATETKPSSKSRAAKEAALSKQRFVAYTSSFANRFKLPPIRPQPELGTGLEAIEIGFGPRVNSEWLGCYMAIYVATSAISNSEFGMEVSAEALEPRRHFFLDTRPDGKDPRALMSAPDAQHLLDRQSLYFMAAVLTTSDYNEAAKSGGRDSMALNEFVRDLFPGLTYIRTRGCVSTSLIKRGKGVKFGIRRKGAPNYSRVPGPWREEHFDHFAFPTTLLEAALPSLEAFGKYIDERLAEECRFRKF